MGPAKITTWNLIAFIIPRQEATMGPSLDPTDPASIRRWEKSRHNVYRSKIEVIDLVCFRDRMTRRGHSKAKPVPIEMCHALVEGIDDEQRIALERFRKAELRLYAKARSAIYDYYRGTYDSFKEMVTSAAPVLESFPAEFPALRRRAGETAPQFLARAMEGVDEQVRKAQAGEVRSWLSITSMMLDGDAAGHPPMLPKIEKGNELDSLVSFEGIIVLRPEEGVSRIGVDLYCPWDEEHGMGIAISGDEIECVGGSGVVHVPASNPTRRKRRKG
jgi:hypothetical protein